VEGNFMMKCTPREIIKEVPDVQTVILPPNWFDELRDNQSVFTSLYLWMLENGFVSAEHKESLHNRTYVGEKIYKKLLLSEKKRLRKKMKIKGDELDSAVGWSDINTGPKAVIGGCNISGDAILVIPESSRQALGEFSSRIYKKQNDAIIKKIIVNAAGASFYQWLLPQIDRPDRVGNIARDVINDKQFPHESIYYEEIKSYLVSIGACAAAIGSIKESWLEYLQKYPERVQPFAWCNECGSKLDVEKAFLAWSLESRELYVLDAECLSKYKKIEELLSRPLLGITYQDLNKLVKLDEVSELNAEDIIEQLKLWGVLPINSEEYDINGTIGREYACRSMSNSRRYDVLRRDQFQCVLCGASGGEAKLEVDHIIPVSKGGSDDLDNLRCLCFKCNRGKHAKIEQ
jgi:uncharacterized protein YozE (UPF0346 family)